MYAYASRVAELPDGMLGSEIEFAKDSETLEPTIKPSTFTDLASSTSEAEIMIVGLHIPGPAHVKVSDTAIRAPGGAPPMPQTCRSTRTIQFKDDVD